MAHISDIKLIRTDTTLDLSQKAEKAKPSGGNLRCYFPPLGPKYFVEPTEVSPAREGIGGDGRRHGCHQRQARSPESGYIAQRPPTRSSAALLDDGGGAGAGVGRGGVSCLFAGDAAAVPVGT
uniref:Uncharacterized protein n=1 Tax=Oryza sativa subsp. japonica TaxID=39947 RepID=Q6ET40_ORYSJ|nr:hypothetical protein [Oryza sativa Japonica Group]BAD28180.1 hypothetical protein [Oryza sativa Japonica Group]